MNSTQLRARQSHQVSFWLVDTALFVLLVGLIVVSRLELAHLANFKPVAATAMFAGFLFSRRLVAIAAILTGMLISDFWLGGYNVVVAVSVYACLCLPVVLGRQLRCWVSASQGRKWQGRKWQGWKWLGASWLGFVVGSSLVFFLVTNFACWLTMGMYEPSWSGLWLCYMNALPFFRTTLCGDLFFSGCYLAVVLAAGYGLGWRFEWRRRYCPAVVPSSNTGF